MSRSTSVSRGIVGHAIRAFAVASLLLSLLSIAGVWASALFVVDRVHETAAEIHSTMNDIDDSLKEVQHAIEPYDFFTSDLSKRTVGQVRKLAEATGKLELAKMIFSTKTLQDMQHATAKWDQALQTRVPAQEVVELRAELQEWRAKTTQAERLCVLAMYAGSGLLTFVLGCFSIVSVLLIRAQAT